MIVSPVKDRLSALIIGCLLVVVALCFFFSPFGQKLEEDFGLALLFKVRGPRPPPENVVIVNLDRLSSQKLGLPESINRWPRTVHARLVDFLKNKGAAAVTFDVHFAESRDLQEDRVFADSIRQAGNVVLYEKIQRESVVFRDNNVVIGALEVDQLIPPFPLLAESALALAPFPLPKLPVRVNQSWIFKTSSGDRPTLPAAAMLVLGLRYYDTLEQVITEEIGTSDDILLPGPEEVHTSRGFQRFYLRLRALLLERPELTSQLLARIGTGSYLKLSAEEHKTLRAVIQMLGGGSSMYLNYYGPPSTFPTYSVYELLSDDAAAGVSGDGVDVKNKVVFVGAANRTWAGQKDGFYTVYSQADGLDLSGVELAATAFANLYEGISVKPLSPSMEVLLIILCGFAVTLLGWRVSPAVGAALLFAFSIGYFLVARSMFSAHGIWPPMVTTLGLQPLITFLAVLYWKFFRAGRERENIKKALSFYLPEKAADALAKDLSFIRKGDQMVYSVCLMTDARDYTTLSERMEPEELSILMKEYYSYMFEPVNRQGGVVSDVVGDSMLALWPSPKPEEGLKKSSCRAAIQILEAVDQFNRKNEELQLPTRIGLHFGYMLIGNIGAGNHFEYAPVGDIVNTVSRIESLNKHLGTSILASEEVVTGLKGIPTRNVGCFILAGKSKPVVVYELFALTGRASDKDWNTLCEYFAMGLSRFREKQWDEAIEYFQKSLVVRENDGPTLFYLNLCRKYQHNPPESPWNGVVYLGKK